MCVLLLLLLYFWTPSMQKLCWFHPLDYSLTPLPMLTYRTIGGILNFFVFLGPSPENVIQQYTQVWKNMKKYKPFFYLEVSQQTPILLLLRGLNVYLYTHFVIPQLIGQPYMPPYWSLGFQLCRYGYNSLEKLEAAVDRTQKAGIPSSISPTSDSSEIFQFFYDMFIHAV